MQITKLDIIRLKVPLNRPMRTRYLTLEYVFCLLLTLQTDLGFEGQGLVRASNLIDIKIMEDIIHNIFSHQLIEKNLTTPEEVWHALWLHKRNHLQSGFGLYALAAIDIALWDIKAQQENKPLYQLFNIPNDFVIPYGNGGWLVNTKQELLDEITGYLERGCHHFKMRVGSDNDIPRLKLIRENFGDELIISADANQYYDFNTALEMSKYLSDFNVAWFEEPLFSNSIVELARLAAVSSVPIATGENMNSHWQIYDACEIKAAHIFQPDVIYQGGITEFKRSAEVIKGKNLTLGAHLFHELSSSLAGLCDKHYVEHIDFFPVDLFIHDFSIKNGKILLPKIPGHGATLSKESVKKYQI